jgi:putative FmdB family regulatory protein
VGISKVGGKRMPTYEYHCEACKHTFSVIQTLAEHEKEKPICPKCEEKDVKRLISIFSGQIGR